MQTGSVKYDGIVVELAGRSWTIPPLSLGQLKKLQKLTKDKMSDIENVDLMISYVYEALSRNYPELTVEDVENELLDTKNIKSVFNSVMLSSGLIEGEAAGAVV